MLKSKMQGFHIYVFSFILLTGLFPLACSIERDVETEKVVAFAAHHDFIHEEDGLLLLEEKYGLQFDEVYPMTIGLTHEALHRGDVDAAIGYASDGKIEELDLVNLRDDKGAFPARNPAPVVRKEVLQRYPGIEAIMNELVVRLFNCTLINLNYLVDIVEQDPQEVAYEWLVQNALIGKKDGKHLDGQPVVIGAKNYTEQRILAQIAYHLLQDAGIPVLLKDPFPGTEAIRGALERGEIDFYFEYTGVAWNEIFGEEEMINDAEAVFHKVAARDEAADLIWLHYAPLNKTYAILMRREHADDLAIDTISDLAAWVVKVRAGDY